VTRVAVRSQRRLGRRGPVHVVDWHNVHGLTPRLADVLQELPELDQADVLSQLGPERSADVPEEMDPGDVADLLAVLNPTDSEMLLTRVDPDDSEPVRRLLTHSPDTAGGLMTSDPVVLTPDT